MHELDTREKMILAGLFLSKFDVEGLANLGFKGFHEAFNTIAVSLNSNPASLKNYRDEFDPYFPNPRKGWNKRAIREYCKNLLDEFGHLELDEFSSLLKSQISIAGEIESVREVLDDSSDNTFAKRLVTGQAAENYFEHTYDKIPEFQGFSLRNTTNLGCGFDFQVSKIGSPFLAIEVKGMATSNGSVLLTTKEYKTAQLLEERYFLFVVRNFDEKPFHTLYRNPLGSNLEFERRETHVVQESWTANIQG